MLARAPQFVEDLLVADLDLPAATSVADGPSRRLRRHHDDASSAHVDQRPRRSPIAEPLPARIAEPLDDLAEVWGALVTGTRDYVQKNGFRSVVLGLSGGIDSAVVATIAADALGPDVVHVVGMPSRYSSEGTVSDAEDLAQPPGPALVGDPDRADGRRLRGGVRGDRHRRPARPGRGEPAGTGARRHA